MSHLLPLSLDLRRLAVAVAGAGPKALARVTMITDAGAIPIVDGLVHGDRRRPERHAVPGELVQAVRHMIGHLSTCMPGRPATDVQLAGEVRYRELLEVLKQADDQRDAITVNPDEPDETD